MNCEEPDNDGNTPVQMAKDRKIQLLYVPEEMRIYVKCLYLYLFLLFFIFF